MESSSVPENLEQIRARLKLYSFEDIVQSLFISSAWIPNASASIQHLFLTTILASQKVDTLAAHKRINTYQDFVTFWNEVIDRTPYFPQLEDFTPEFDWGQIKFHYGGKNYHILYGGELSNQYDYFELFNTLYVPADKVFTDILQKSPKVEFESFLKFHDKMITSINPCCDLEAVDVEPGHREVPSEIFWHEVKKYLNSFQVSINVSRDFLDEHSIEAGSVNEDICSSEKFVDSAFYGTALTAMFLKFGRIYYPILPRRHFASFFQKWSKNFSTIFPKISPVDAIQRSLNVDLSIFIGERIGKDDYFPLVSAVEKTTAPHPMVFCGAIISKKELILIHVLKPSPEGKDIPTQLEKNYRTN